MKEWAKPGLETLNVSMTMNNNALNSVTVTEAAGNTSPVETPINDESNSTTSHEGTKEGVPNENDVVESETVENVSGGNGAEENDINDRITPEQNDSSSEEEDAIEQENELDPTAPNTPAVTEGDSCASVDTLTNNTDSDANGLFAGPGGLFIEENRISEEFVVEGSCDTPLILENEEMAKALAALTVS